MSSSTAYVYPDGEVYGSPQASKSDDYFTITDCDIEQEPTEVFAKIEAHFSMTGQAFWVASQLFSYTWQR